MRRTTQSRRSVAAFATLTLLAIALCLGPEARAQWTTSGANIGNTNTGNVGVGTTSPEETLHVLGNVRVGFGPTTLTKINAVGGMTATDTTLTVLSTASYPSSGTLLLEREAVTYTGKTATTFTGLTRGMFNTIAVAHADQIEVDTYLLNVQIQSSSRPKFVVTGKGFVGIGRHAPTASLHIAHSGDLAPIAYDANAHGQGLLFNQYTVIGDAWRRYTDIVALGTQDGNSGGSAIRFITNPINTPTAFERMRIDRDGNVGIGVTAPFSRLEVGGSASRNTLTLTGDGDTIGYAGLRIQAQTTTNIAANRSSTFNLHMRKDGWYGGDGSGPSFIIETTSKTGGFAAPFLITPNNHVILNGGQGASGLSYGNVGVGTTNPTQKLDVAGNVNAAGLCLGGTCKTNWSEISQWASSATSLSYGGATVNISRAASPGPAEFRIYNGGQVAEWSFRQAGSASHNLNISKNVNGVYTDYMTVDTAGNVGVGTAAPASKLHVGSGSAAVGALPGINVTLGGNSYVSASNGVVNTFIGSDTSPYGMVGTFSNHPLGLRANNTLAMTIMPGGNVGVGVTAPAHKLDVAGNVNASGLCLGGDCKTNWSQITGQWTTSGSNLYYIGGSVGIGTNAPASFVDAQRSESGDLLMRLWNTSGASGTATFRIANSSNAGGRLQFSDSAYYVSTVAADRVGGLRFRTGNAASEAALSDRMAILPGGNVGVGTTAPSTRLHVGAEIADDANRAYDQNALMVVNQTPTSASVLNDPKAVLYLGRQGTVSQAFGAMATFSLSRYENAGSSNVGSRTRLDIGLTHDSFSDAGVMTLLSNGKVGVGKTNPTEALDVQGNIVASGNIAAKYQDVAEWVPSTQKLAAGTVVVLDTGRTNHVLASAESYDTKVAGVISEMPGLILGEAGEGKVMVATTGRVKVRVDATRGAIKVGDLLVTSDVSGVAMKSEPMIIGGRRLHAPGTIVGKALEPLEKGTGEILVLLSLQ